MVKIANKVVVLLCGILVCMLSIGICDSLIDSIVQDQMRCLTLQDKSACQALIDYGLPSVEQCTKDTCGAVGQVYSTAGHFRESIPYFERVIALGDNRAYYSFGLAYFNLNDYFNAKKYFEIGCNKVSDTQVTSCYNLGIMYFNGKGVRQDYYKARELYKKACDMKYADACNNLGVLYFYGQGVKQNRSIAKQYYGKACDLGSQMGCDSYKLLNNQGCNNGNNP